MHPRIPFRDYFSKIRNGRAASDGMADVEERQRLDR
jgi:hypothetical protein